MGALKNIRHEHFIRLYIENGGNASDAYRRVAKQFPVKPLINLDGARAIATVIRRRPEVRRREQELRRIMAKKADITMDRVLTDIEEAFQMAKMNAKTTDMINAKMAQAKLVGLLHERIETGQPGDFSKTENISDILEKVQADIAANDGAEAGAKAALALAEAFGYAKTETAEDAALAKAETPSDAVN